jgi:hypothetical protein
MTDMLSTELGGTAGLAAAPVGYKPAATVYGARLKRMRASFTMASQATTVVLQLGTLPAGATFSHGLLSTDTSLASATLAIGIVGTTGKYRTAATFTSTNTPTLFGNTAAIVAAPATADTPIIGTIATDALPSSGNLCIDIFYSSPN